MKQKVLLLMTSRYSIYEMISSNLEKMGYEVTYKGLKGFKYENFGQRLHNFFRKNFLRDKKFKDYLRQKQIEKNIQKLIDDKDYFDYALVIKPDEYSIETIHHLKKVSKKVIGYHWDGFSRFNIDPDLINAFDVFGVFDKTDYENNVNKHSNLILTQNFYFDILPIADKTVDLFYIGVSESGRIEKLIHLINLAKKEKITYDFNLFFEENEQNIPFNKINKLLSYKEVLEMSSKSRVIIDLKFPLHNGLSLRFFEALYFSQKVITDNKTVKEMDFYHPNDILVVDDFKKLTQAELKDFLNKEYIEIPKEIKQKYSFESWFNQMIN